MSIFNIGPITTFTEYTTAGELEKSFSFENAVEITSHVRFPIHATCVHMSQLIRATFPGVVTAKFHYGSWFEAGLRPASKLGQRNGIWTLAGLRPAPNQLA